MALSTVMLLIIITIFKTVMKLYHWMGKQNCWTK